MARESGAAAFNGLHLRLEADASAWIELLGGVHRSWQAYREAMRGAGFAADKPMVRCTRPAGPLKPWKPYPQAGPPAAGTLSAAGALSHRPGCQVLLVRCVISAVVLSLLWRLRATAGG